MRVFIKGRKIVIGALMLINSIVFCACGGRIEPQTGTIELPSNEKTKSAELGEQVVAEYLKRDAAPYRKSRVRMTISSPSETVKSYELEVSRKQTPDETITLTQVIQPASENDLASLTIERKGQSAVNITRGSAGQFRETGTNKMFFGGLTAQELLGEWDKYDYRLISEKVLDDGVKVYEIEGTIKPSTGSVIARTVTLFRSDNYQPAELRLFGSGDKKLRTFRVTAYRDFEGRTVASHTEIENHIRNTKIDVEILSLSFPDRMEDEMFTRDWLKRIAGGGRGEKK